MTNAQHQSRTTALQTLACLCFMLFAISFCGCQIAPKEKSYKWPWKKDEVKKLPDRILPVWTESVLHQPNQPGVRGFGGRIYFYEKDNTDPIEIDGSLAVYVFDADDIDATSQKPLRKFMFTKEQFAEHMSKTSIGPSYSIWLPWGEIGGPPRRLSLIARFEGSEGGTVISDPTIKLLPGVPVKEQDANTDSETKSKSTSAFRLSSHQKKFDAKGTGNRASGNRVNDNAADDDTADDSASEASEESSESTRNDIKTIELPPSFQRHLRGATSGALSPAPLQSTASTVQASQNQSADSVTGPKDVPKGEPQTALVSGEQASLPPIASQTTTQVYDYRTRKSQGASMFSSPKNDIRQGRWIESIARD